MASGRNPHMENLRSNIGEVNRLLTIHTEIGGTGPGYKHNIQVLNKSAVILLTASWESFVEDLAELAFNEILANAKAHTVFSNKVLAGAAKELMKGDETQVWDLAGENWRAVLEDYKGNLFKRYIGKLNTPRHEQIDELYSALFGLRKKLSSTWYWSGMSVNNSRAKLDRLITLRGSIAHRVTTSRSVTKIYVTDNTSFIWRLATISNNRVLKFVGSKISKRPWSYYKMGSTS